MSDFSLPSPHSVQVELAATNRKLTTAILGMTLLTGLVACLSYLAGRTVTKTLAAPGTEQVAQRVEKAPGPLVIEPLRETVSPAPALMAPAAPIQASTPACPSATGDVYFQVGLVNFPQGSDLVEQLKQQGYTVKLAPLEGTSSHRVLVGPVNDAAVQEVTGRKLREQGYTFFRRRW